MTADREADRDGESVPAPTDDRAARNALYERAVVEIELAPGERVELRVGDPPPTGIRRHGPLYVLTAFNPGGERPGDAENRRRQDRLEEVLRDGDATPMLRARGRDPHSDHAERSVAVGGLGEREALDAAREFGQDAIFAIDDSGVRVVDC